MPRIEQFTILSAKASTGIGNVMDVASFDFVVLSVGTASSANLTMKAVGAATNVVPVFTDAQSITNQYDFLHLYDMENISTNLPAMVRGDTGFAPAGTDDFRLFRVDVRGLKWLNLRVTARSAGNVTVYARGISLGSQ